VNSKGNETFLTNTLDHETTILEKATKRSMSGNEGTREVKKLGPHVRFPEKFYTPRGNRKVRPIGPCGYGRFSSLSFRRIA
jgi:hypothetical protein